MTNLWLTSNTWRLRVIFYNLYSNEVQKSIIKVLSHNTDYRRLASSYNVISIHVTLRKLNLYIVRYIYPNPFLDIIFYRSIEFMSVVKKKCTKLPLSMICQKAGKANCKYTFKTIQLGIGSVENILASAFNKFLTTQFQQKSKQFQPFQNSLKN